MKSHLVVVLVALALAPAAAGAGPARSPALGGGSGGRVLGLDGSRGVAPAAAQAAAFVPVPVAAGAEVIDSTWYDLQDMGSLGTRIVVAGDGTVHVTYETDFCELAGLCPPNLAAPEPFPWRGMAYAIRGGGGGWTMVGKVQDPALWTCSPGTLQHNGGFGTIDLTADGRAAISQHAMEDGRDLRGDFYLESAPGSSAWKAYLTPISDYDFPQIVANPNGSFTLLAEIPQAGSYRETDAIAVSYLAAEGPTFTCPFGWQMGTWTSFAPAALFRDGKAAFPSLAASANGRVGVAVGDFGGNVYLIESSAGTFAPGTITIRNLTNYGDATITAPDSTSTQYRPYVHCSLAYNDTTPHVVWSEVQARRDAGGVFYADWRSRIMHWDPFRGVEVVKQVAAGEADRYDDVDLGLDGPSGGTNHISIDWPQVGFSADGLETYVVWIRFSDAEVDPTANMGFPFITGIGFGDVACSVTRPGAGWAPAQNLTQTPNTDERYVSLAERNPGGRVHLIYQASAFDQAGCNIFGDRGTTTENVLRRIVYQETRVAGSFVGVAGRPRLVARTLSAAPNPARSRVGFRLDGGAVPAGGSLAIFSPSGRLVARARNAGGGPFEWDGRDDAGRRVAAGVYFARLEGAAGVEPVRFTLLP
jgi:hypothetical protein